MASNEDGVFDRWEVINRKSKREFFELERRRREEACFLDLYFIISFSNFLLF